MSPEQRLWQSVVLQAILDATQKPQIVKNKYTRKARKNPDGTLMRAYSYERNAADAWIRGNSSDFRMVVSLAKMEPDFVRDAYMAGRINREAIKKSTAASLTIGKE
jgi:hypothetical protein